MMNNKKRSTINIETIIIILIAGCIIFLNTFTTNKLFELEKAASEAMFIKDGIEYTESEQLGQEIIKYHPDSCKMIEMYDDSFNLLFSLQFDETSTNINDSNINDYPELIKLLENNVEGQTEVTINGYDEDVYFQWIENNRNENRLVIVYSTKPIVEDIWVFSFVCYLVLILIFILLIRIHTKNYNDKIIQYQKISDDARSEINRK